MTEPARYGCWEVVKPINRGGQGQVYLVRDASGAPGTGQQLKNLRHAMMTLVSIQEESAYEEAFSQFADEIRRIESESQAPLRALKKLLPFEEGAAEDKEAALERMKRELSVLESVNHPSLVQVLDSNLDQRWFVMEFFEGGTLSNHLQTYKGRVLDALRAFRPIVDAVSALHTERIVHRDIKPDNIFVASDGHLVLGDCGLAFKLENQERLTGSFENVGTRDYQPSWSYGMRLAEVQPTFDVFSLAKVLWAMVSGRPKFPLWYFDKKEHDLRRMFPDDPAIQFVHEILRNCVVESENETRVHDAGELLAEIETTIATLSHDWQLPGSKRRIRCRFCGIGTYKRIDSVWVMGNVGIGHDRNHFHLICDHCGHVEWFIWLDDQRPPAWDESG